MKNLLQITITTTNILYQNYAIKQGKNLKKSKKSEKSFQKSEKSIKTRLKIFTVVKKNNAKSLFSLWDSELFKNIEVQPALTWAQLKKKIFFFKKIFISGKRKIFRNERITVKILQFYSRFF